MTPGNDFLIGNDLHGGYGDDTLMGTNGGDKLDGGHGHDLLFGQAGDDFMNGYYGNDTLHGGDGNDRLEGGHDHDLLFGDGGNDLLIGYYGDDTLNGGSGNDNLNGGKNDDVLDGGTGVDKYIGDYGNDTLIFDIGEITSAGSHNAGRDFDTLQLRGVGTLDLTVKANNNFLGIEQIDMDDPASQTLRLNATDVLALSDTTNTLRVLGDSNDTVDVSSDFGFAGTSGGFDVYTSGSAVLLVEDGGPVVI